MRKLFILLGGFAFGLGCIKNPPQQPKNQIIGTKAIAFQWQYIYASRCPYNPASLAPCLQYSSLDPSYWNSGSSFLKIDTNGTVYQNIQGTNGSWSIKDTFQVVQISDSLLHISLSDFHPGASIKIKAIQDHLLVLEYIGDTYDNSFGLDSLIK
jgi:hypothetical protein